MPKRVTPKEASDLLSQGYRYVDVRSIPEFEAGHPEGAFNVPLMHSQGGRMVPNPEFQQVMSANFSPSDALLIGCKMGGRSMQAASLLEAAGFSAVVDVRGGYSGERDPYGRIVVAGWADSQLPVATQAVSGHSYAELSTKK
jgi:rhodanese-related sulfurtransferase